VRLPYTRFGATKTLNRSSQPAYFTLWNARAMASPFVLADVAQALVERNPPGSVDPAITLCFLYVQCTLCFPDERNVQVKEEV
jgi:hypothetical protein